MNIMTLTTRTAPAAQTVQFSASYPWLSSGVRCDAAMRVEGSTFATFIGNKHHASQRTRLT